jgi:RNA-directed DNA polymerase
MPIMIKKLNQTLRGWANYHRHVVSSEAFSRIDKYVFEELWRMLRRRHPGKSVKWLFRKYWDNTDRKHIFAVKLKTDKGLEKVYKVIRICSIAIRRHIKIRAAANPYAPEFSSYFWHRRNNKERKLLQKIPGKTIPVTVCIRNKTQSGSSTRVAFKTLEPCDGKLSRTVLRGERGCNAPALPGESSHAAIMTKCFKKKGCHNCTYLNHYDAYGTALLTSIRMRPAHSIK